MFMEVMDNSLCLSLFLLDDEHLLWTLVAEAEGVLQLLSSAVCEMYSRSTATEVCRPQPARRPYLDDTVLASWLQRLQRVVRQNGAVPPYRSANPLPPTSQARRRLSLAVSSTAAI